MSTLQKVIKYLALAFAIFIIVSIISGILYGFYGLSNVLGLKKSKKEYTENLEEIAMNIEDSQVSKLKIDLEYSNLKIQKGETFKSESNSSDITCIQKNNQLVIQEKNHNWFSRNNASELVVYIPENMLFDEIKIEAGAGEVYIETLEAKELDFEIGAGKVAVQNLEVSRQAKIDGGAGKVEILSGTINDLDLDMGVGEFILKSKLTGRNDIDSGVGRLDIDLTDNTENYTIKVEKGLGSIRIDGKEVENNKVYGDGETYISIDGGVGSIIID